MRTEDVPRTWLRRWRWRAAALAAMGVVALSLILLPLRPGSTEAQPRRLAIQGFSILENVFRDALAPEFTRQWEARGGQPLQIDCTFKSLGPLTNELLAGAPARLAFLTPEFGARQLIDAGRVSSDPAERLPHRGIFAVTPFVIVVRPGNPLGIRDFADLTRADVSVVHCDPRTSGGGYWAIIAEHGSAWRRSGRWQDGYEQLLAIWRNVCATGASAREARALFEAGRGDALITYEQDVLWGQVEGTMQGQIVYPDSTVVAEICLVILKQDVQPADRETQMAFASFLWGETAQRLLRKHGFRSHPGVSSDGDGFPRIEDAFRIEDLGGWKRVRSEILEHAWRRVQRELGL